MEVKKMMENVTGENVEKVSEENKIVWNDNATEGKKENEININAKGEEEKVEKVEKPKAGKGKGKGKGKTEVDKKAENEKPQADATPVGEQIKPGTIFYLTPNNKFGEFVKYGKTPGIVYLSMFKKDSMEKMSKDWSVKLTLLEEVATDGKILNDKFVLIENKGYQLVENVKKEAEESAKEQEVATTDANIENKEEQLPEAN